jgi:multicomponent Na+:H+ antiporter subunit E
VAQSSLGEVFQRLLLGALFWMILTSGSLYHWGLGVLAIGVGVALSLKLLPRKNRSLKKRALLPFLGFFFFESLRGGSDVAWRALSPSLPLKPTLIDYSLDLKEDAARVFFVACASLLPGTLSVRLTEQTLRLHILNEDLPYESTLKALERHIQAMLE